MIYLSLIIRRVKICYVKRNSTLQSHTLHIYQTHYKHELMINTAYLNWNTESILDKYDTQLNCVIISYTFNIRLFYLTY